MQPRAILPILVVCASWGGAACAQPQPPPTFDAYVIDVEGGEATLFVSPSGESLLVDTGWSGFDGRDAERITRFRSKASTCE
jgi:competence protein ComEC